MEASPPLAHPMHSRFLTTRLFPSIAGLELIMNYILGRTRSVHWALVRSMLPVMFLSAFLNNTPCVTFMIPSK